jgi:hypothetical protein
MKVTAFHMVDGLATGLYESVAQRLMELIRNGLVASMVSPEKWEPKRAKIEISLVPNHPLSPNKGTALLVLDHGRGLTDPDLDRYFQWLGTPLSQLKLLNGNGLHHGASQKGMGRLAGLALNENCLAEDAMMKVKHGYYLLTRTGKTGDVRFVNVIPEKVEMQGGFNFERFISPTATEMGPIKGIDGSFTAIVIPTPVFKNHAQIYDEIKWFLPRERDKMFALLIGGKAVQPPPLEGEINLSSVDGRYRARLGVSQDGGDGVWLCDSDTGFRVASCQKMGSKHLPDPLWFPDLAGDIFAPGLLRHQNTARSTLAKEFMKSSNREWQRLQMFLIRDLAPAAKRLIERDMISGKAADTLNELVDLFHERFGEPETTRRPRLNGSHKSSAGGGGGHQASEKEKAEAEERKRRYVSIKVRDEVYHLYRGQSLHPHIFAQVNPNDRTMIFVNVRGEYQALPEQKVARQEHCLMQVLGAIGRSKFPSDLHQATLYANEVRAQFLT